MDEDTTNVNELFAKDFKLGDLHLHEGSQFEYLFDFGDCWWFDIRVKRYSKGHQKNPEIIVIKGEAPLQYPEFY